MRYVLRGPAQFRPHAPTSGNLPRFSPNFPLSPACVMRRRRNQGHQLPPTLHNFMAYYMNVATWKSLIWTCQQEVGWFLLAMRSKSTAGTAMMNSCWMQLKRQFRESLALWFPERVRSCDKVAASKVQIVVRKKDADSGVCDRAPFIQAHYLILWI